MSPRRHKTEDQKKLNAVSDAVVKSVISKSSQDERISKDLVISKGSLLHRVLTNYCWCAVEMQINPDTPPRDFNRNKELLTEVFGKRADGFLEIITASISEEMEKASGRSAGGGDSVRSPF